MSERIKGPRGARDLIGAEVVVRRRLEEQSRDLLGRAGYSEIRPALFEETELFVRSIGEVTDIVEKEMFTVHRDKHSLTFRPEGTAGVVRAYLDAGLHKAAPFQKWFYMGPMFRYERPQKGRERQFDQIGLEVLGSDDPLVDAEVIDLAADLVSAFGIEGAEVRLNSMGDGADRDAHRDALTEWVKQGGDAHCATCQERAERNVFRVLDCKNPDCVARNSEAPASLSFLSDDNRAHFAEVGAALDGMGRTWLQDDTLVRGLDYYTRTVFEIHVPALGARSAVCGGGRYDHLAEALGGPAVFACGCALGVTPITLAMDEDREGVGERLDAALVVPAGGSRTAALALARDLRERGLRTWMDMEGRSMKGQLRDAGRRGAAWAVICGPEEEERGEVRLKCMDDGQETVCSAGDPAAVAGIVRGEA